MKLNTANKFNLAYPNPFDFNWLNDPVTANKIYQIFYNTIELVDSKYPDKKQRYVVLSRLITQAKKIQSIDTILFDMKLKIEKETPYYILTKKYLEILIKNNGNTKKSLEELQEFKPTENKTINEEIEIQMPKIISTLILKINQYLEKNNFELK